MELSGGGERHACGMLLVVVVVVVVVVAIVVDVVIMAALVVDKKRARTTESQSKGDAKASHKSNIKQDEREKQALSCTVGERNARYDDDDD